MGHEGRGIETNPMKVLVVSGNATKGRRWSFNQREVQGLTHDLEADYGSLMISSDLTRETL